MVGRLFTQMELFGVEHVVYEQNLKNLMESINEHTKGQGRNF
jgi:hypothetical protein